MDYEEELLDDVATDDFEDACNQPSKENERTNSSATSTATFTATGMYSSFVPWFLLHNA